MNIPSCPCLAMPHDLCPTFVKESQQVKLALPALERLVHSNDEELLTDACWTLSYLLDGPNDKIQAVIDAGVCPRLFELLMHPAPSVLIPALRIVGNIVTGDDVQTQEYIGRSAPYNERELNEVREQWAKYLRTTFLLN